MNGGEHICLYLIPGDIDPIHGDANAQHGFNAVVGIGFFVVEPFMEFLGRLLEMDVLPGVEQAFAD